MTYIVFYKTTDVFAAEERLNNQGLHLEIVPTPVTDKAYCGVCIKLDNSEIDMFKTILHDIEYIVIQ